MNEHEVEMVDAEIKIALTPEMFANWFWGLDSQKQAEVLGLVVKKGQEDYRAYCGRNNCHEPLRLPPDWQWLQIGTAIGDLPDDDESDQVREFVFELYKGMLRRARHRIEEWQRA